MFDLLIECPLLRRHLEENKVAFGINHPMRDFAQQREKNLDLVICRSSASAPRSKKARKLASFAAMVRPYSIILSEAEKAKLATLPDVSIAEPATVLLAIEAKACMTEFGKARPRLYDELNSAHLTIHGDTNGAIAAGLAIVNISPVFISPLRNPWSLGTRPTHVNRHDQPSSAASAIEKIHQLKRRSHPGEEGFDAVGIIVVDCANDGSPIALHKGPPAPTSGDPFRYEQFIGRLAHIYATRFSAL